MYRYSGKAAFVLVVGCLWLGPATLAQQAKVSAAPSPGLSPEKAISLAEQGRCQESLAALKQAMKGQVAAGTRKQAGVLGFANPQVGSLTGGMVEEMLKRPEFAGIERRPVKGLIGEAIARGDAPFGGGAITEEINVKDAEVVGPFPDDFGLHVDVSAAVLKTSAHLSDAEAFLRYVTRPEAASVWKAGGIVETPR